VQSLTHMRNSLRASRYIRDTRTNALGLGLAALIPLLATPILSRLYSPAEFGLFGIFFAATAITSGVGSGKYEVAIILNEAPLQALETAMAGVAVSLVTVAICVLAVLFWGGVQTVLPLEIALLAPLAILLMIQFNIALNCAIRARLFFALNVARALMAGAGAFGMVFLGLLGWGAKGLALGLIAGQCVGLIALLVAEGRIYGASLPDLGWRGVLQQMRRFRDYPKFAVLSDLANAMALWLPFFVLPAVYGAAAAGFLLMFQRVWSASAIIGKGMGETFRQKAAEDLARDGNFRSVYRATFWAMLAVAVPAWLILVLAAPGLFAVMLGEEWREAGVYGQILATLVCVQFIASPLGWAVYIFERLRYNMVWQWSLLLLYLAAFAIGTTFFDARGALALYAATGAIMYAVYLGISYRMSAGISPAVKTP